MSGTEEGKKEGREVVDGEGDELDGQKKSTKGGQARQGSLASKG